MKIKQNITRRNSSKIVKRDKIDTSNTQIHNCPPLVPKLQYKVAELN
jgi:hypothetical protein